MIITILETKKKGGGCKNLEGSQGGKKCLSYRGFFM